jgi:TM2 domain-containing membrane protein YozV
MREVSCFGSMKSLYASYASQSAVTLCRCLVLLLLIGLGACQRSTYLFQRVAEPEQPSIVLAPSTASALVVAQLPKPNSFVNSPAQFRHQAKHQVRLVPAPVRKVCSLLLVRSATQAIRTQVAARSPQDPLPPQVPANGRSRGVAFLLAFLLGGLGLHLFYLGYKGRGLTYLLMTVAAFVLLSIGAVGLVSALFGGNAGGYILLLLTGSVIAGVVSTLALIDAILILTNSLRPLDGEYYPRFFQTRP